MSSTPNPRDVLRQIVTMFGYDPDMVISVSMDQYGSCVTYRVATATGWTVQTDGFFFPDLPSVPVAKPITP